MGHTLSAKDIDLTIRASGLRNSIEYKDNRDVSERRQSITRTQVVRTLERVIRETEVDLSTRIRRIYIEPPKPINKEICYFLWYVEEKGVVYPVLVHYAPEQFREETASFFPEHKEIDLYGNFNWRILNSRLLHEIGHSLYASFSAASRFKMRRRFQRTQADIREKINEGYPLVAALQFVGMPTIYGSFSHEMPSIGTEVYVCRRSTADQKRIPLLGVLREYKEVTPEQARDYRSKVSTVRMRQFATFRTNPEEAFAESFALLLSSDRKQLLWYGNRPRIVNMSVFGWYKQVGNVLEAHESKNISADLVGRMRTR